jgi:hypothetical protein
MIGQYLPNNNKTATVMFRQKFYQLNSLLFLSLSILSSPSLFFFFKKNSASPPFLVSKSGGLGEKSGEAGQPSSGNDD